MQRLVTNLKKRWAHMKNRIATTLILAILCTAVGAQTTGKSKANDQSDLENFRAMIQQHPRALAELKNNPSVVSTPEFASEYRAVGQYLAEHPQVKDQVRNQLKSNRSILTVLRRNLTSADKGASTEAVGAIPVLGLVGPSQY